MRNVFLQTLLFLLNKILIFFCKEMKLTYSWFICKKFQKNRPSILMSKIGEIICALRENISMRDRAFGKRSSYARNVYSARNVLFLYHELNTFAECG